MIIQHALFIMIMDKKTQILDQIFLSLANHIQDQYIFIHDAMLESLICGDTELDAGNFRASLDNLLLKDLSGRTEMDRQFAVSTLQYKLFHKVMQTLQYYRYWAKCVLTPVVHSVLLQKKPLQTICPKSFCQVTDS